jgi:hemoglobin-like flavoprotein
MFARSVRLDGRRKTHMTVPTRFSTLGSVASGAPTTSPTPGGALTTEQIALIRTSWRRLQPIRETAAALFYRRLFELDPSLARLFRGDMAEQGEKLMAMLGMVVSQLHRLSDVVPAVEALGRRHAAYGVEDGHYDTVATALLGALQAGLGDGLTREAEGAWAIAYGTLADVMKRAASGERAAV